MEPCTENPIILIFLRPENINLVSLIYFYGYVLECNRGKIKEFIFFSYICLVKLRKECILLEMSVC